MQFDEQIGNWFVNEFAWADIGHEAWFDGRKYRLIAVELNVEEHRWADTALIVLLDIEQDKLVGFPYDVPASESQDGQGWFAYTQPGFVEVGRRVVEQWYINA